MFSQFVIEWYCKDPISLVSLFSAFFVFLVFTFAPPFHFCLVVFFFFCLPFLVRGIPEHRSASKCQGSQVKHMQHVLQFITTHLLWDFSPLTSLSKLYFLLWTRDWAYPVSVWTLSSPTWLAGASEILTIPEGFGLVTWQPNCTSVSLFIENICKGAGGTSECRERALDS